MVYNNVNSIAASATANSKAILVNTFFNFAFCAVFVVIYLVIKFLLPEFYSPKRKSMDQNFEKYVSYVSLGLNTQIQGLSPKVEKLMVNHMGLDSFIAYVIIRFCFQLLSVIFAVTAFSFFPILMFAKNEETMFDLITRFAQGRDTQYGNTWIPVLMVYLQSLAVFYFLFSLYRYVWSVRRRHVNEPKDSTMKAVNYRLTMETSFPFLNSQGNVLIVRNIPSHLAFSKHLKERIRTVYNIEECEVVFLVNDYIKLKNIEEERITHIEALEKAFFEFKRRLGRAGENLYLHFTNGSIQAEKPSRVLEILSDTTFFSKYRPTFTIESKKLDALNYHIQALEIVENKIDKLISIIIEKQNQFADNSIKPSEDPLSTCLKDFDITVDAGLSAFVILPNRLASTLVKAIPMDSGILTCETRICPPEKDIIWKSLFYTPFQRYFRSFVASFMYLVVCIGQSVPISAVTSSLAISHWSLFSDSFVQGSIAPALHSLFLLISPYLFRWIEIVRGTAYRSEIEISILKNLFTYQWIQTFVLLFGMNTILEAINAISNKPYEVLSQIQSILPNSATFLINTLILKSFFGIAMYLLRPWQLLVLIIQKVRGITERQRLTLFETDSIDFPVLYSDLLIPFVFVFSFSVLSPLVSVLGLIYILAFWAVLHRQLIYALHTEHETNGMHWPIIFEFFVVALYSMQFVTSYSILSKGLYMQAAVTAVSMVLTYIFRRFCTSLFRNSYLHPGLEGLASQRSSQFGDTSPFFNQHEWKSNNINTSVNQSNINLLRLIQRRRYEELVMLK